MSGGYGSVGRRTGTESRRRTGSQDAGSPLKSVKPSKGAASGEKAEKTNFRVLVRLRPMLKDEIQQCRSGVDKYKPGLPAIDFDPASGQVLVMNDKQLLESHKGAVRFKKKYPDDLDQKNWGKTAPFAEEDLIWSFSDRQDWEREGRERDRHDVERTFKDNAAVFRTLDPDKVVADLYGGRRRHGDIDGESAQ
eukprot:gene1869-31153_t